MDKTRNEWETSLFRIMSFNRLVEIFQRRELYFSHPSNWEDPYETILSHKYANAFFAQCWCKKGVSDAMWRIYSPHQIAVLIRTTPETLKSQMNKAAKKLSFRFMIEDVKYLRQAQVESEMRAAAQKLRARFNADVAAKTLFFKRDAFSHESEVRVVVYPNRMSKNVEFSRGIRIPIDPYELIRVVLVDPRAPQAYVDAYKYYLQAKLGYRRNILKSMLYSSPESIVAL